MGEEIDSETLKQDYADVNHLAFGLSYGHLSIQPITIKNGLWKRQLVKLHMLRTDRARLYGRLCHIGFAIEYIGTEERTYNRKSFNVTEVTRDQTDKLVIEVETEETAAENKCTKCTECKCPTCNGTGKTQHVFRFIFKADTLEEASLWENVFNKIKATRHASPHGVWPPSFELTGQDESWEKFKYNMSTYWQTRRRLAEDKVKPLEILGARRRMAQREHSSRRD